MIIVEDVGVYHEGSGASQYHFNMLKRIRFDGHRHYYSVDCLDQFIKRDYKVKFAGFHVPFPVETDWLDRLNKIYEYTDRIFVFCSELHTRTEEQLRQLDRPKITIFVNGSFNQPFYSARVYKWMDWFIQTLYFYKELHPEFLSSKLQTGAKSLSFDVLLGAQRLHRDFVYDWVKTNLLEDKIIMTYYNNIQTRLDNNPNFIMESEGIEILPNTKFTHSIDQVLYYGHRLGISCIVPLNIYNQTNYSLVAETNFENHYNFYTEKIVKPIMAKRLFVVISGQHYLKNLKDIGFKTFDSIIDESYDDEPDCNKRWTMALEQMNWLCKQDPIEILAATKHIVDFNYNILFDKDWYHNFSEILDQELRPYLQDLNLLEV